MNDLGENLIFLISLPRSGSTLLQHILAGHSEVAATAEPWVLFPAVYALRPGAMEADYNPSIGQIALTQFLSQLEEGEDCYYAAVRKMALHLYGAHLAKTGKQRFLDKTSRYYLALPEVFRIFPDAKFIFLLRNPLAMFASFLDHMVFGDWRRLGEPGIRNDLLDGYRLVRDGIRYFGDDAIVVRYEDLVDAPEPVVSRLCERLGLHFEPGMLRYGDKVGVLQGKLVDPKSIHKHQMPVKDYAEAWKTKLQSRQSRHLARAFLAHLGKDLVESMGYSFDELMGGIPLVPGRSPIASWQHIMYPAERRSRRDAWGIEFAYRWQQHGRRAALRSAVKHPTFLAARLSERAANTMRSSALGRVWQAVRRRVRGSRETAGNPRAASTEYHVVNSPEALSPLLRNGWQDPSLPDRQLAAYRPLLEDMRQGKPRQDFVVAAQALRLTRLSQPKLIEVGCGNGYYSEILSCLTRLPIDYVGLDYSAAMIASAQSCYPQRRFLVGSAMNLPVQEGEFDVVWSGTILMHIVDYPKAIRETARAARRFCVFHSTPLLSDRPTTYLWKKAYGSPVAEVIINQAEFESLLHENGLRIRHVLKSLPYDVNAVVQGTVHTLTYVCEKRKHG